MKQEYVRHLFLYRSTPAIETRLRRYAVWFNGERAHQGLGQRTPDDIYFDRPAVPTRDITGGTLQVWFLDGDKGLPIMISDPECEQSRQFMEIARNLAARVSVFNLETAQSPRAE